MRRISIGKILSHLFIILICITIIIPLMYIVSISFTSDSYIVHNGYPLLPREVNTIAYKQAFAVPEMLIRSYGVTIFVTIAGTSLSLSMTTGIAYVASRRDFRYRKFLSVFLLIPLLFNGGIVSQYLVNTQLFHLGDTILALFLPYGVNVWYAFMMRSFMNGIPFELIEAAKIDGANEYKTFFRVVLPLCTSALATIGLFYAFAYWNDWWLAMIYIMNQKLIPLQYMLQRIMQNIEFFTRMAPPGMATTIDVPMESLRMALALLAAGPMLIVFPFFQKYFVEGVAVGAVKG